MGKLHPAAVVGGGAPMPDFGAHLRVKRSISESQGRNRTLPTIAADIVGRLRAMTSATRNAVMFTIVAHEDTGATELDQRASAVWDRKFADSSCAGRVRVPRPISSEPHPTMRRHVLHTYEGVMWE